MSDLERKMKRIDQASLWTLVITVILFAWAAFEKGLTHDLLLEAGVLLVSAKLVISTYQAKILNESIKRKLDELTKRLDQKNS